MYSGASVGLHQLLSTTCTLYIYLYGMRVSLSKDASIMDTHVCTIRLISEAICGVCGFIPHLVNPLQRQACDHLGQLYPDVLPLHNGNREHA